MNSHKNLFIAASALLASATAGLGEVAFYFNNARFYRQSPTEVKFNTGALVIYLRDGNFIYGCGPSLVYFPPSTIPPCPLGATGYLVSGDANDDGVRDDFLYYEVFTVVPGVAFEPSRPDLVSLYSAPPSTLPRPIGVFSDLTLSLFYNIVTDGVVNYKMPRYRLQRNYTTRTEMDQEVVTGRYVFAFPRLHDPNGVKVQMPVEHYPIPEGRIKQNHMWQGWRFTQLNGKPLTFDANGFVLVDSRVVNTFDWIGNTENLIFPTSDVLHAAINTLAAAPAGDPTRPYVTIPTIYPGYVITAATQARVLLPSPLETELVVPPGFMTIPGITTANPAPPPPTTEALLRVALDRDIGAGVTHDVSQRVFELPLKFGNTYEGWAAVAFPAGTPASVRARDANPDRDAYTNYIEWRNTTLTYFSNPMAVNVIPPPVLTFVASRALRSTDNVTPGYWESSSTKTPGAYPPITYEYEFSTDMVNWATVGADDPDWLVTDTETDISIRSKHAELSGQGFLRVKSTQQPEPPPILEE